MQGVIEYGVKMELSKVTEISKIITQGRRFDNVKVERIIDGDTISLNVDAGFDIWHRIRVRVRDLYCDETDGSNKEKGLAAKAHAETLLPPGTIVKIQTYKTATADLKTFDRYVADISTIDDFDFAALMILHGFGKAGK